MARRPRRRNDRRRQRPGSGRTTSVCNVGNCKLHASSLAQLLDFDFEDLGISTL